MAKKSFFPLKIDKWDSGFFKIPIARLHISGRRDYPLFFAGVKDLLARAAESGTGFIFIRLENPVPRYEKALLKAGMID